VKTQGNATYRRVHTYLPPPPPPALLPKNTLHRTEPIPEPESNRQEYRQQDLVEEIEQFSDSMPLDKVLKDEEETTFAFGAEAYPSPRKIHLPRPVISQSHKRHAADPDAHGASELGSPAKTTAYRPPSPPTSDLPVPADDDAGEKEVHVEVDVKKIRKDYRSTKALRQKVLLYS
jgi:hypothetical protein